ncbi:unnamed protein product [Soboliphyme baturini]|uniref:Hypoxia up-regulated protein 1 n=1 Tax=Soboliphyme baturini TaxID=241478 RepID=A0A183J247_9BILA|nr:unnamed protein product [Soboliphyme baturini]
MPDYILEEDKAKKEKVPKMSVMGVGYQRTGGLDFTVLLRDYLAKRFTEAHHPKTPIYSNPRAMSKLLVEGERVKKHFSFNPEVLAQVETLHEGKDFRVTIPREEFEPLCEELLNKVTEPVADALKMAGITANDLDFFILMGAGTRMPAVQQRLQALIPGKELNKFLNTDEAIAMGAVFEAAHQSKGFRYLGD